MCLIVIISVSVMAGWYDAIYIYVTLAYIYIYIVATAYKMSIRDSLDVKLSDFTK